MRATTTLPKPRFWFWAPTTFRWPRPISRPPTLTFALAPGSYKITTQEEGRPAATPVAVTVAAEAKSVELTLPATGRVSYQIGGDGFDYTQKEGLPSRVSIQAGADAAIDAPILRREFTADGKGTFLLEPGPYTLIASRGYEYEIYKTNITVEASKDGQRGGQADPLGRFDGWIAATCTCTARARSTPWWCRKSAWSNWRRSGLSASPTPSTTS